MSADLVFAQSLAELVGHPLDETPSVDKYKSSPVGLHLGDDLLIDLGPHLMRGDGAEFLVGKLDPQIQFALVPHIDDLAVRLAGGQNAVAANQESRHFLDGLLRGAQTDVRCNGRSVSASSRSRESARWSPRLSGATAWISSTMTVSALFRKRRLHSAVSRI